jgi:hypothetical protein
MGWSDGQGAVGVQGTVRGPMETDTSQTAVIGICDTAGVGVAGHSSLGRGGVFSGLKAAVRLLPAEQSSHPARGQRGDLVVDSTGRLWYCKKGGTSPVWKQLA